MNTAELADKVAAEHDLGKAEAKRMVETVLTTIAHAAVAGEEVSLAGFGKFKVGERQLVACMDGTRSKGFDVL